jgi:2-keto-3-deoxy-galactonokinase
MYVCMLAGFLRRMLTPEGGSNLTWPLAHMYRQHSLIAEFLLSQAHADWDADTFKEGVKQAIEYSTQVRTSAENFLFGWA